MSLKQYTSEHPMSKIVIGGLVGMIIGALISIILHLSNASIANDAKEISNSIKTSDSILNLITMRVHAASLNEVRLAITCIFSFFGMILGVIGGSSAIVGIDAIVSAITGAVLGSILFCWMGAASVTGAIISAIAGALIGSASGALLEVFKYLDQTVEKNQTDHQD